MSRCQEKNRQEKFVKKQSPPPTETSREFVGIPLLHNASSSSSSVSFLRVGGGGSGSSSSIGTWGTLGRVACGMGLILICWLGGHAGRCIPYTFFVPSLLSLWKWRPCCVWGKPENILLLFYSGVFLLLQEIRNSPNRSSIEIELESPPRIVREIASSKLQISISSSCFMVASCTFISPLPWLEATFGGWSQSGISSSSTSWYTVNQLGDDGADFPPPFSTAIKVGNCGAIVSSSFSFLYKPFPFLLSFLLQGEN